MQGLQQIFRQHEKDKPQSMDNWKESISSPSERGSDHSMHGSWKQGMFPVVYMRLRIIFVLKQRIYSFSNIDPIISETRRRSSPQPVPCNVRSPEFGGYVPGNWRSPHNRSTENNGFKKGTPTRRGSVERNSPALSGLPVGFFFFRAYVPIFFYINV